jgi:hypothetical protein
VGKQKGGASSSRSYTAMLRSVDRDNEKSEGIKTVSMTSLNLGVSGSAAVAFHSVAVKKKIETLPVTPVNLFPTVLANGSEEMRTAMSCNEYELGFPGSLATTSIGTTKKTIETKGSFVVPFAW